MQADPAQRRSLSVVLHSFASLNVPWCPASRKNIHRLCRLCRLCGEIKERVRGMDALIASKDWLGLVQQCEEAELVTAQVRAPFPRCTREFYKLSKALQPFSPTCTSLHTPEKPDLEATACLPTTHLLRLCRQTTAVACCHFYCREHWKPDTVSSHGKEHVLEKTRKAHSHRPLPVAEAPAKGNPREHTADSAPDVVITSHARQKYRLVEHGYSLCCEQGASVLAGAAVRTVVSRWCCVSHAVAHWPL